MSGAGEAFGLGEQLAGWRAPGPVAEAFLVSEAAVSGLMGPIGSGKTSTNFIKHVVFAGLQQRSAKDGRRKYKLLVVRQTYRELWRTTIPSWWAWVPKTAGSWVGADNAPATHAIQFGLPDGSPVDFTVEFVAIGDNAVEDVLRGYEPTAAYLNEADLLSPEVLQYVRGRVGRYPKMDEGGPSWFGVTMDFNAPEADTWLYELMTAPPSPEFQWFVQPSGFSGEAENTGNLPPGYYRRQASGQPVWYVQRMIENRFAPRRDGQPVYPEFNDELHVARAPLEAAAHLRLSIGLDAGRQPAAVVGQRDALGRRRILGEFCMTNAGAETFGRALSGWLAERFPEHARRPLDAAGNPSIVCWADPAAANPTETDERTWISIVAATTGLRVRPAPVPNNSFTVRREAVARELMLNLDGGPAFLLDPGCTLLRRGFNSGYRYRKLAVSGAERYAEEPEKNAYSHPHDALHYLALGDGDHAAVLGRRQAAERGPRQLRVADDWGDAEYAAGGGR